MTDACSDVKADLKAGTYTRFKTAFPIYIEDKDTFKGGNVYIILRDAYRNPIQTVDGMVVYTEKGCSIEIVASSTTIKDDLYLDVEDILTGVNLAYIITNVTDLPIHKRQNRISFDVSMIT